MKASFDATGEVLIVTGGARGIGAAAARAYADAGGRAYVLDVAPSEEFAGDEGTDPVAGSLSDDDALHPGVTQLGVDVADRDAVRAAVAEIAERHGRIDGLIAGAAVQPRTALVDMDPEEWRGTLAVNLDGVVWAVQAVLPTMRA